MQLVNRAVYVYSVIKWWKRRGVHQVGTRGGERWDTKKVGYEKGGIRGEGKGGIQSNEGDKVKMGQSETKGRGKLCRK